MLRRQAFFFRFLLAVPHSGLSRSNRGSEQHTTRKKQHTYTAVHIAKITHNAGGYASRCGQSSLSFALMKLSDNYRSRRARYAGTRQAPNKPIVLTRSATAIHVRKPGRFRSSGYGEIGEEKVRKKCRVPTMRNTYTDRTLMMSPDSRELSRPSI